MATPLRDPTVQVEFLRDKRIMHQIKLARDPELSKLGEQLCDKLGDYFEGGTLRTATRAPPARRTPTRRRRARDVFLIV